MEQTKPFLAGSPAHYISKRSTGGTTTKAALSIAEVVRLGGAVIRQKIISIIYCFRSGFNLPMVSMRAMFLGNWVGLEESTRIFCLSRGHLIW